MKFDNCNNFVCNNKHFGGISSNKKSAEVKRYN